MKKYNDKKKITILIISIISMTILSCINYSDASKPVKYQLKTNLVAPIYTPHLPIRINGDSDPQWTLFPQRTIIGLDINGTGYGYCIYIGNCSIPFKILNCFLHHASGRFYPYFMDSGLMIHNSNHAIIQNNTFLSNQFGPHLMISENCTIENNDISYNLNAGIGTASSKNYNILKNKIYKNHIGIYIEYIDTSSIHNNSIYDNSQGLFICYSTRVLMKNNFIYNNFRGSCFGSITNVNYFMNNTVVSNQEDGIYLDLAGNTIISGNNFSLNKRGIHLGHYCDFTIITNNTIFKNTIDGINLGTNSNYTFISYNNISYNIRYGIYSDAASKYCRIHHNNFIINNNGTNQAWDITDLNFWNTTTEGNHWSEWTTPDTSPKDGIVDQPYRFFGGTLMADFYPLVNPVKDAGARVTAFPIPTLILLLLVILPLTFILRRRK